LNPFTVIAGGNGGYGGGGGGGQDQGGNGGFGGGGGNASGLRGSNGGNGGFGGGGGSGCCDSSNDGRGGAFAGDARTGDGGGGASLGGVIFNDEGTVVVRNSTFSDNVTIASGGGFDGGSAAGGAIFSRDGSLTVVDSTFEGNRTFSGAQQSILAGPGSGIVVFGDAQASFELDDTIIADGGPTFSNGCYVRGNVSASGVGNLIVHNADGVPGQPFVACPGVAVTADPQLGPLQDNGGFTPTSAIPFGSAAMSAADSNTSLATDQRGETRPQVTGGWDIGAYEVCRRFIGPFVRPFFCSETTNPGPNGTSPLTMDASVSGAGAVDPPPGSHDEPNQSVIVVTATPNPGYVFVGWSGNVTEPTKPTTTIVINQAQSVTALFALEETGFVPPDKPTAACEDGVVKTLTKLSSALVACHVAAADAAAAGKSFDEETCEQLARGGYDAASGKLKGCPACLDAPARGTLADEVAATIEQRDAEIHCAGTVALGDDDGGFVPPDKTSRKCEDAVAKNFAALVACVERCHVKTADLGLKGKPFDEEACETTNVKGSCRAKYTVASARLLKNPLVCPTCLGVAQQATLGDQAERDVDALRGSIYCAGTTTLEND
jgi:uncharacterized repeat protein (TIGR02543 family)